MNKSAEKLIKPSVIIEDQNLMLLALSYLVNEALYPFLEFWEDEE